MCTYLGSLPAALAHDLIARWSRPGDVVLDPFCGRGTVPLQASLERRIGVGIDRNPLAQLLTAAALDPPSRRDVLGRIELLRIRWTETRDDWRALLEGVAMDPRLNQRDGIHPNAEGARLVADHVWTTLDPLLQEQP